MKRHSITACCVLLLAASVCSGDQWNKQWSVGAKPELHVTAGNAAIVVEAVGGSSIDATLRTRGYSIGGSGVRITQRQTGDRVDLEIKEPPMHFNFGDHSMRLELRVPKELTGYLHTGDGSITLRGVHGPMQVDTGDGSIQGENLDGMLDAHSGDGSVHVSGRFDNLQVRTQDGSVDLEIFRGSRMRSDWRVHTGDGSVRLSLPRDFAADLDLHTGDGHIRLNLPVSVSGTQRENEVRGKLNGGGPLLTVRTGDGSVSLNPSSGS
ncbi:MAG TPA: DUF4097 family beta strand repeat-containing protein [Bryobacteraceae bacterium]|jgi:hypothetical protein